ncbi:hypothetical protein CBR_g10904 [Chara braunii]|uniref:Uncharacterized protein n=1 Tax=Chara braunii TaxID=69332 RepID=A0A388KPL1_CHABU|nr:hypothetical protein CBR_g10904 [Chara braunii]|eukprot:GBG71967.1 hypothetical protein CBR_g10904 [Chara braunii]
MAMTNHCGEACMIPQASTRVGVWKSGGCTRLRYGANCGAWPGPERSRSRVEGRNPRLSGFVGQQCGKSSRNCATRTLGGQSRAIAGEGEGSNPADADADGPGGGGGRCGGTVDVAGIDGKDAARRRAENTCFGDGLSSSGENGRLRDSQSESEADTSASTSASETAMERSERRRILEENWDRLTRRFFIGGAALTAVGLLIEGGGARLGSKKRRRVKGRRTAMAGGGGGGGSNLASGGEMDDEGALLRLDVDKGQTPLMIDYSKPGPYEVRTVLRQEHTCSSCFPHCVGGSCLLRIAVTYPGRGAASPLGGRPFPLAIFSGGFLVGMEQYQSYANRLASWGYVVLTYNKAEGVTEPLDDELCAQFITDLIDWAGTNPLLKNKIDTERVYLCGHSRGGKVSVIAAANDPRVVSLCLIDPVDNTVYAPLAPGYPSAVAALRAARKELEAELVASARIDERDPEDSQTTLGETRGEGKASTATGDLRVFSTTSVDVQGSPLLPEGRRQGVNGGSAPVHQDIDEQMEPDVRVGSSYSTKTIEKRLSTRLPIVVVGAEITSDCAPSDANYRQFFNAAAAPSWEVVVKDAGHFQFVDEPTLMQNAVCGFGEIEDAAVRMAAQTAMIAWGELTIKGDGDSMDDGSVGGASALPMGQNIGDSAGPPFVSPDASQRSFGGRPWSLQEALLGTASSINRKVKVSSRIKL